MKIKCFVILASVFLTACHTAKSVMIRNDTKQPLTLMIPVQQNAFFTGDGLSVIHFEAKGKGRDTVLWYSKGQWTNTDKKDLAVLLHTSKMAIGKDTLPVNDIHITRYGLIIRELFVKIK